MTATALPMKLTTLVLIVLSLGMRPDGAYEEIDYDITAAHEGLRKAARHAISLGEE